MPAHDRIWVRSLAGWCSRVLVGPGRARACPGSSTSSAPPCCGQWCWRMRSACRKSACHRGARRSAGTAGGDHRAVTAARCAASSLGCTRSVPARTGPSTWATWACRPAASPSCSSPMRCAATVGTWGSVSRGSAGSHRGHVQAWRLARRYHVAVVPTAFLIAGDS